MDDVNKRHNLMMHGVPEIGTQTQVAPIQDLQQYIYKFKDNIRSKLPRFSIYADREFKTYNGNKTISFLYDTFRINKDFITNDVNVYNQNLFKFVAECLGDFYGFKTTMMKVMTSDFATKRYKYAKIYVLNRITNSLIANLIQTRSALFKIPQDISNLVKVCDIQACSDINNIDDAAFNPVNYFENHVEGLLNEFYYQDEDIFVDDVKGWVNEDGYSLEPKSNGFYIEIPADMLNRKELDDNSDEQQHDSQNQNQQQNQHQQQNQNQNQQQNQDGQNQNNQNQQQQQSNQNQQNQNQDSQNQNQQGQDQNGQNQDNQNHDSQNQQQNQDNQNSQEQNQQDNVQDMLDKLSWDKPEKEDSQNQDNQSQDNQNRDKENQNDQQQQGQDSQEQDQQGQDNQQGQENQEQNNQSQDNQGQENQGQDQQNQQGQDQQGQNNQEQGGQKGQEQDGQGSQQQSGQEQDGQEGQQNQNPQNQNPQNQNGQQGQDSQGQDNRQSQSQQGQNQQGQNQQNQGQQNQGQDSQSQGQAQNTQQGQNQNSSQQQGHKSDNVNKNQDTQGQDSQGQGSGQDSQGQNSGQDSNQNQYQNQYQNQSPTEKPTSSDEASQSHGSTLSDHSNFSRDEILNYVNELRERIKSGELNQDAVEVYKDIQRDKQKDIIKNLGNSKGFMNLIDESVIGKDKVKTLKWYNVIEQWILSKRGRQQMSYAKPNKRYLYSGVVLPGKSHKIPDSISRVVTILDVSGSMKRDEITDAIEMMLRLKPKMPKASKIYTFADNIHEVKTVSDWRTGNSTLIRPVIAVIDLEAKKDKDTLFVLYTDCAFRHTDELIETLKDKKFCLLGSGVDKGDYEPYMKLKKCKIFDITGGSFTVIKK